MKAIRAQIAKIHIAQKELRLSDADYRNAIRSYGVEHANDLDYNDAEDLIEKFKSDGFKVTSPRPSPNLGEGGNINGWGKQKYTELDSRGKPFAKSIKLRKIEAMWRDVSNSKTDESLRTFIKNRTGIDDITFLHDGDARKIITALEMMKQSKIKNKSMSKN
jgi:hypothetical protein